MSVPQQKSPNVLRLPTRSNGLIFPSVNPDQQKDLTMGSELKAMLIAISTQKFIDAHKNINKKLFNDATKEIDPQLALAESKRNRKDLREPNEPINGVLTPRWESAIRESYLELQGKGATT